MPDDLRDVLARTIRARVRLTLGPNASRMFKEGNPVILTGGEADDAADAALAALADHGLTVVDQEDLVDALFLLKGRETAVEDRLRAVLGTEKPRA